MAGTSWSPDRPLSGGFVRKRTVVQCRCDQFPRVGRQGSSTPLAEIISCEPSGHILPSAGRGCGSSLGGVGVIPCIGGAMTMRRVLCGCAVGACIGIGWKLE